MNDPSIERGRRAMSVPPMIRPLRAAGEDFEKRERRSVSAPPIIDVSNEPVGGSGWIRIHDASPDPWIMKNRFQWLGTGNGTIPVRMFNFAGIPIQSGKGKVALLFAGRNFQADFLF